MGKVLISFVGKSASQPDRPERGGYSAVQYMFSPDGQLPGWAAPTNAFFGAALVAYFEHVQQPVDKWIVLGTQLSNWAAVIQAASTQMSASVAFELEELNSKISEGRLTQADLNLWRQTVQKALPDGPECEFQIVGNATESDSQMMMWNAILNNVEAGDSIVLDVTHAYRHMPVIAAFMINAMRPIKQISSVDMYYGAFELAVSKLEVPVVHIEIVKQLTQVADAASIFRNTGNYEYLLEQVGFRTNLDTERVLMAEETNVPANKAAASVLRELNEIQCDPIQAAVTPLIRESLQWVNGQSMAKRMYVKTQFAYRHGQYFKAITLLWESILVAGCHLHPERLDGSLHVSRAAAENYLRENYLEQHDKVAMRNVSLLRNATVHGTRSDYGNIHKAIESRPDFSRIFDAGLDLLERLLDDMDHLKSGIQT